jgi:hypothetical protein
VWRVGCCSRISIWDIRGDKEKYTSVCSPSIQPCMCHPTNTFIYLSIYVFIHALSYQPSSSSSLHLLFAVDKLANKIRWWKLWKKLEYILWRCLNDKYYLITITITCCLCSLSNRCLSRCWIAASFLYIYIYIYIYIFIVIIIITYRLCMVLSCDTLATGNGMWYFIIIIIIWCMKVWYTSYCNSTLHHTPLNIVCTYCCLISRALDCFSISVKVRPCRLELKRYGWSWRWWCDERWWW